MKQSSKKDLYWFLLVNAALPFFLSGLLNYFYDRWLDTEMAFYRGLAASMVILFLNAWRFSVAVSYKWLFALFILLNMAATLLIGNIAAVTALPDIFQILVY